jgi:tripartite motif-containing protein 71
MNKYTSKIFMICLTLLLLAAQPTSATTYELYPNAVFPVADFESNVIEGYTFLSVQFADLSDNATAWNWNFGDGTYSTEQNPVHTYSKVGKYNVNLTVENAAGSNSKSKLINLNAVILKAPGAAFSASPTSGKAPLKVTFTDKSTGKPTSWNWNFGDGNSSTEQNPVHTYSKVGLYTVKLTVKNADGSGKTSKSKYIYVKNPLEAPSVVFSASPTSGKAPLTVNFTDKSTNSPTSWNWNFGDGNTSTEQNPVHTYSKVGQYTVKLKVKNAAGSSTISKSDYIKVINPFKAPNAAFSAKPTSGKVPLTVNFTDKSTNIPTSWKWNFGDGTSSTEQNPVHTYCKAGKYTVKLKVKNPAGSSTKTLYKYIVVSKK